MAVTCCTSQGDSPLAPDVIDRYRVALAQATTAVGTFSKAAGPDRCYSCAALNLMSLQFTLVCS